MAQKNNHRIRFGVVGVGYLGQHHARILSRLSNVELVGVYDIDVKRGQEIAKQYNTRNFPSLYSLLDEVEAVNCAVPTGYHYEVGRDILERGKHLLLEKPMAMDSKESLKLIEIAKDKDIKFQIGHIERFNPATIAAIPYIKEPKYAEVHRISLFNPRGTDVDVVLDLMIHDIDLILKFFGKEPVNIQAAGVSVITDKIDMANVRFEFNNGEVVNLTSSRAAMKKKRKMRIFQKNSYIGIDFMDRRVEYFKQEDSGEILPYFPVVRNKEPLKEEIKSFVNAILKDTEVSVPAYEAYRSVVIAERIMDKIQRRLQQHSF